MMASNPRKDTAMMLPSLLLVLVTVGSAAAQSAASLYDPKDTGTVQSNWRDRPGTPFSLNCGHEGMAACSDVCVSTELQQPDWCPKSLTSNGCLVGLTRVFITPGTHIEEQLPDICMALPKVGIECGAAGKPCCLHPNVSSPSTLVRPMCSTGSSCMITDPVTSLPYGGTKHMTAVLTLYPGSQGLLLPGLMGTCRSNAPLREAEGNQAGDRALTGQRRLNTVLGVCGQGQLRCPYGTYCASNEDHMLGGARCVPLPECGGPYQQCCPPFSNGDDGVPSIVDKRTAVPTCNDPEAVCVWKSWLEGFDPSSDQEAVQLLTPPGSTSIAVQYPDTLCVPGLAKCGQEGQPCCPHAQFAMSSHPLYFRLHVCDPGLRCDSTISVFRGAAGSQPVLGMCRGEQQACGTLGQQCCSYIDQAGWEWRTCGAGESGMFCGADGMCTLCPSTTAEGISPATLAALSLPGVGNPC